MGEEYLLGGEEVSPRDLARRVLALAGRRAGMPPSPCRPGRPRAAAWMLDRLRAMTREPDMLSPSRPSSRSGASAPPRRAGIWAISLVPWWKGWPVRSESWDSRGDRGEMIDVETITTGARFEEAPEARLRERQRRHWDRIAASVRDFAAAPSTLYYRRCEIALIERAVGDLRASGCSSWTSGTRRSTPASWTGCAPRGRRSSASTSRGWSPIGRTATLWPRASPAAAAGRHPRPAVSRRLVRRRLHHGDDRAHRRVPAGAAGDPSRAAAGRPGDHRRAAQVEPLPAAAHGLDPRRLRPVSLRAGEVLQLRRAAAGRSRAPACGRSSARGSSRCRASCGWRTSSSTPATSRCTG